RRVGARPFPSVPDTPRATCKPPSAPIPHSLSRLPGLHCALHFKGGSMASLIESLTQSFTPDLLGLVGKATGLDGTQISKGLGIVGPLVTGALANRASTPDGLSGLMNSLSQAGG